ncbi:MAG: esterase/lipase family protein, partial [Verrucomicrobiales bacterium]
VADFSGANRVRIRIYDTMLSEDVSLSGRRLPLAANYSASLTKLMSYSPEKGTGFEAMKHPDAFLSDTGIFMVEPYRPGQIPVLLVHGLKHEPGTWRNTYNELIADPTIREKFQFWFFRYPTGFPISYTTNLLRQHLDKIHAWSSANGGGAELNEMVLVGHSMGSVISSIQMRESGKTLERLYLTREIDALDLDAKAKEGLRKLMIIEPPKYVSRAIFIAAPHRGAKAATGAVGAFGNMLIDLSKKVTELNFFDFEPESDDEIFTDLGASILLSPADGIRSLRPNSPGLLEIVKLPIGNHITYHSIIGDQGKEVDAADSSDGVVDYWSSHLDGVASEKIIPSKHSAHEHPEGIAEIRRILLEHLEETGL